MHGAVSVRAPSAAQERWCISNECGALLTLLKLRSGPTEAFSGDRPREVPPELP
jgi:hypothetical protein